jgi:hypothetical protein
VHNPSFEPSKNADVLHEAAALFMHLLRPAFVRLAVKVAKVRTAESAKESLQFCTKIPLLASSERRIVL